MLRPNMMTITLNNFVSFENKSFPVKQTGRNYFPFSSPMSVRVTQFFDNKVDHHFHWVKSRPASSHRIFKVKNSFSFWSKYFKMKNICLLTLHKLFNRIQCWTKLELVNIDYFSCKLEFIVYFYHIFQLNFTYFITQNWKIGVY